MFSSVWATGNRCESWDDLEVKGISPQVRLSMWDTYLREEPNALQTLLLEDLEDDFDNIRVIRQ